MFTPKVIVDIIVRGQNITHMDIMENAYRTSIRDLWAVGINATDDQNRTPLFLAAKYGYADLVEELIAAGADLNAKAFSDWTPLYMAIYNTNYVVSRLLIAAGADVNIKTGDNWNPLHI